MTTQESHDIPEALGLTPSSHVLEIGCGSGRYALQVAETSGCRVVGVDINEPGIRTANQLAAVRNLTAQVRFEHCDVSKGLPFGDSSFDVVFSNDALCRVPDRLAVLQACFRVLKPGRRMLFSDALVIGGMVSHREIEARSLIGCYLFNPPGENERLIAQAGFRLTKVIDTTESAARIGKRWHDAREKRRAMLLEVEKEANFEGVQRFLACVYTLTSERRSLRYVYVAQKPV